LNLQATLIQWVETYGVERTYWVAYSGGIDSHVLLHALAKLRDTYSIRLIAVYINHGMSPWAANWGEHCQRVCADLAIEYVSHAIEPIPSQKNSESRARQARYQIFKKIISQRDLVLTAHHEDDQAETVLLQLLRGAGPKGLAAMPALKPFGVGYLARPLLPFSKKFLYQYAVTNSLNWIEDESNLNISYMRNFLRHEVMPILTSRMPSVRTTLARVATHCASAQNVLTDLAKEDLAQVAGTQAKTLSISKLLALPVLRLSLVMREWLQNLGYPLPSEKKLNQILLQMLTARPDRIPRVIYQQVELRRYRDNLFALKKLAAFDATQIFFWDLSAPIYIPQIGTLHAKRVLGQGMRLENVSKLSVRFRQGGEVICFADRGHHQTLKNLWQSLGVAPWLRDRTPLLFVADELVMIEDFYLHSCYAAHAKEMGWVIWLDSVAIKSPLPHNRK
jgi:tRNA(Ile)-lysidine synthase